MAEQQQTVEQALELLKSLQSIHNEMRTLEELLVSKPADLKEAQARLAQQREASSSIHDDAQKLQMRLKDYENDLAAGEEKIAKLKVQQNMLKTNREYKAMQEEIDNVKVEMSRTEDQMLEIMAQIEDAADQERAAKRNVSEEELRLEAKAKSIQSEIDEIQAEYDGMKQERDAIAAQIDARYLEEFDRLSNIKGGVAVAAVRGQICTGCFINLTAQTINVLKGARELTFCQSCGRILYLE